MEPTVLIIGAGLSGAVIARELAEAGIAVRVAEARPHLAGNCHTARDPETGVLVHVYGPHIFHTADAEVWAYVNRHASFQPYRHRVMATARGRVYALPINLHTLNQLFGTTLRPSEARAFVQARTAAATAGTPASFESLALATLGREIYETFFAGYTRKQWGRDPAALPAAVLQRLPVRFTYDDSYFAHPFQGLPRDGYTAMVARILNHPLIEVQLNTPIRRADAAGHAHVFHSGPLDGWFGHRLGRLAYRTLDFERFTHDGDWQGCAVMNYPDPDVPWTRITEHRHFAPWESPPGSVLYREFPRECEPGDVPYYPVRLLAEKALLGDYVALARAEAGVTHVGRLGTYRYIDMDVTIREALDCARLFLACRRSGRPMPAFAVPPLPA